MRAWSPRLNGVCRQLRLPVQNRRRAQNGSAASCELCGHFVTLHGGVARNNPFLVEPVLLEPIPQTPFPFDLSCVRLFLKRPSHLGASCFNPFPKRPSRFSPLPKRPSHFNSHRLNPFDCFRKCVTVFESVPQNLHPGNGPCNTVKTSMQQFSVRKRTADISGR